ncbi:hypothetical protein [Catellatospora paridis]|uniref:hypothetical protein n=1 Tax=Catellatospora paridis TaxID=1617086 RepID=UPI0012D39905|nr:hypothetical protein [Catellatospora paridis]
MNLITTASSPTADVTGLMEPLRTSPAANAPDRLVSSRLRPARRARTDADDVVAGHVRAGQHEPVIVDGDLVAEPRDTRARHR